MFTTRLLLVVVLALQFTVSRGWAEVTFQAHFDGPTADADYALGSKVARPAMPGGQVSAVCPDGRFTGGLDLKNPERNCVFDGAENFNPRRGTVDFWFRIDEHKEGMYHPLFGWYRPPHLPGKRERLSGMEVYYHNSALVLAIYSKKYKSYTQRAPFRLKAWHHCEIHWDCSPGPGNSSYSVSLDGQPIIGVHDGEALTGSGGQIHIGIWDYGFGHSLRGVIDELRITDQVEHPLPFRPPSSPSVTAGTLDYARQTHRIATQRLKQLLDEAGALTELSGARGNRPTTLVIREAHEVARRAGTSLSSLANLLKEQKPSTRNACKQADLALGEINEARFAMRRITARAEALGAEEDKRSLLFKDLNDELLGDAILLRGKQLVIDDFIIEKMHGCRRELHQPTRHPRNPVIVADKPWEKSLNQGSVIYDRRSKQFQMWYTTFSTESQNQLLCYATSADGIRWQKPVINRDNSSNIIPTIKAARSPNVYFDALDADLNRRYKMLYSENSEGNDTTNVAFSSDGISWVPARSHPVIDQSDSNSLVWDPARRCYVAFVGSGPSDSRVITRAESNDFLHWSPPLTVLGRQAMDSPFDTNLYGMRGMSYARTFLGFLSTNHGETDRTDVQLAFSRNGITWQRVSAQGTVPTMHSQSVQTDWRQVAQAATFLPCGKPETDWDGGQVYPFEAPIVLGDRVYFYYLGLNSRHSSRRGDSTTTGIGLATLRRDGFVSITAAESGVVETRPFVAIGDTLVVNANATGSIRVEAIDALGRVIKGFSKVECTSLTGDSVEHVVSWESGSNCQPLQARPIQLRFHLQDAQLYSFAFKIRHNHYVPNSYRQ